MEEKGLKTNFIYLFIVSGGDVGTCHGANMEVRGQLSGVSFLLPCWSQRWNSDYQARWQAPLYTEPSHWVRKDLFKRKTWLRHSLDIYNREKHFNERTDAGAMYSIVGPRMRSHKWQDEK